MHTFKWKRFISYLWYNKKKIIKEIKGSFVANINGLSLIDIKDNKKILLCACKKYISSQRNGIFIINPEIKENVEIYSKFYDTEEFEVNCFCPINIKKDNEFVKTEYFFVGGFDSKKKKGMIKLYKIIYNDESNIEIKYLQDIFMDNINDYELINGSINCMVQSKINGKIFVSCWNGKVYLFSEPNINYYLSDEISHLN